MIRIPCDKARPAVDLPPGEFFYVRDAGKDAGSARRAGAGLLADMSPEMVIVDNLDEIVDNFLNVHGELPWQEIPAT